MILCERHGFVFVHVPKCAGTTVRQTLAPLAGPGNPYWGISHHPVLGDIDHAHIPLAVMRDHFPDGFAKLRFFQSFAVTRDPHARFTSALMHWFRHVGHIDPLTHTDEAALAREVDRILKRLDSGHADLDPQFVHFARQSEFLELDGERIVQHIYPIDEVRRMIEEMARLAGRPLNLPAPRNVGQTGTGRRVAGVFGPRATRTAARLLPGPAKETLRRLALRPRRRPLPRAVASPEIRAFVAEHYSRDVAIHAEATGERVSETPVRRRGFRVSSKVRHP